MNRHQFEQAAKHFRAGRLTLTDFSAQVFPEQHPGTQSSPSKQAPKTLPNRNVDAHKGDFGRVLMIGGSQSMPGAIGLAGMAALRSGSGLVVIATPESAAATVASFSPCYMTHTYSLESGISPALRELADDWADVIAIGPGLGTDDSTQAMVVELYHSLSSPVVVDADALNCLAQAKVDLAKHEGLRVLTPHPGEFNRLANSSFKRRDEMEKAANDLAKSSSIVVVLKGHKTLVTDGTRVTKNQTGNAGMATGGSGDVLTGMVASLVGQGMSAMDAAVSACHFHGLAGDLAAKEFGQVSLISSDLLDFLPKAFQQ